MGGANSPSGGFAGDGHDALLQQVQAALRKQLATPLDAGLYLVATPIGNLADISLRALAVLARADLIYCEDKRHSSRLLNHYGLQTPLRAYHEHNGEQQRGPLLEEVEQGRAVALISDAGAPLISDPGYKLVVEAKERQLPVVAIPGPSAPMTALVSAGLPTDEFHFAGFLPPKKQARRKRLAALAQASATLILFESPKRLAAALRDICELFPDRQGAVARELTKLHEEVVAGPVAELAARFDGAETVRGEIVLLLAPASKDEAALDDDEISALLAAEMQNGSLRDAVKSISVRLDLPRNRVYDLAVALRKT